ncbi:MAG TPA: peptidase S9, prolyl oligopeptidase [Chitinophagaceae bacterium]|nr:peptidase S9, prolyl oligopeptidase [Chitinophagaceae bacterium]
MALAQQPAVIAPGNNLIVDGIPSIPLSIKEEMQFYSESRSAGFAGWHPINRSMLISTRFGNTNQLHQLAMPMGARRQMTFFEDAVSSGSYEPLQGKYVIFSKDAGGNEFAQLYRLDLETGKTVLITDGGRSQNSSPLWSRSGKQMAYASTKRNGADRDIYIMDPANPSSEKQVLQLKGGGWGVLDWSPDDKQLLLMEYISANESRYWLAEIATGAMEMLTGKDGKKVSYGQAKFAKDGRGIYFLSDQDFEFKRLAYMNLASRSVDYISKMNWDVDGFDLSEDGKQLVFITNEAGQSVLYHLQTTGKAYSKIDGLPVGVYSRPDFHRNGKDIALSVNTARSASDIYVVDITTKKTERWTESEMGGMAPDQLSEPRLVTWKSFDGLEISGFYYGAHPRFNGKRPVVINIHGGPEGQSRPVFLGSNNFFLNEMGVVMIFPNVRGSAGFGKTFIALDNGMKREESVKDIGALLDWIAQQPELDASRVMVTGGSYGGYMTLAVATHYNDRIRCGLDVVGISNFNTFLKNTESYRRDLRRVEYGDERDTAMYAFLEKISPLTNAGKITKPLFIVQGGNDPRVPRTEAVQMADKVKANGGEVWYLEAKDEGHGFRKKANADFQRYATVMFMRKYLLE